MITVTSFGPCSARALGFGSATTVATDPYYSSVSLLMHCDGANTGTVFTDNGPLTKTITAVGGAVTSNTQFKFGNASLRTRNAGDEVTCTNTGFDFGTGDFTVECWVYYDDLIFPPTALASFFSNSVANTFMAAYGSSTSNLIFYGAAGPSGTTGWAHGMTPNVWSHVAWVRNGNNRTIFVNGSSIGTAADLSGVSFTPSAGTAYLGSNPITPFATINSFADEFRITKGVARYTSSFTPPNAPFPNS